MTNYFSVIILRLSRILTAGLVSFSLLLAPMITTVQANVFAELAKKAASKDAVNKAMEKFADAYEDIDPEAAKELRKSIKDGTLKANVDYSLDLAETMALLKPVDKAAVGSNVLAGLLLNSGELICAGWVISFRLKAQKLLIENPHSDEVTRKVQALLDYVNTINRLCKEQGFLGGDGTGADTAAVASEPTDAEKASEAERAEAERKIRKIAAFTRLESQCFILIEEIYAEYVELANGGEAGDGFTVNDFDSEYYRLKKSIPGDLGTLDGMKSVLGDAKKAVTDIIQRSDIDAARKLVDKNTGRTSYLKPDQLKAHRAAEDLIKRSEKTDLTPEAKVKRVADLEKQISDLAKKIADKRKRLEELARKLAKQLEKLDHTYARIERIVKACGDNLTEFLPPRIRSHDKATDGPIDQDHRDLIKSVYREEKTERISVVTRPVSFKVVVSEPTVCVATTHTITSGEGLHILETSLLGGSELFAPPAGTDGSIVSIEPNPEGEESTTVSAFPEIMVTTDPTQAFEGSETIIVTEETTIEPGSAPQPTAEPTPGSPAEQTSEPTPKSPSGSSPQPAPTADEKTTEPGKEQVPQTPTSNETQEIADTKSDPISSSSEPVDDYQWKPEEISNPVVMLPTPTPNGEPVPDLGLVKAQDTVVKIALEGNNASAIEGSVIKFIANVPPLPGSSELAEIGEIGEELFALSDDVPAATTIGDALFRTDDAYVQDVAGGEVGKDGNLNIAAPVELTNQIGDDVVRGIGAAMRSGELAPFNTLERRMRAIWMKGIRDNRPALEEAMRQRDKLDEEFEKYGKVGLNFKLEPKVGLLRKSEGLKYLEESKKQTKKDSGNDKLPIDEMGGGTMDVAPPPPLKELEKIQEAEKRKKDADPELGDGEEILMSAPAPGLSFDDILDEVEGPKAQVTSGENGTEIAVSLPTNAKSNTRPIVVTLEDNQRVERPSFEYLVNTGFKLAEYWGVESASRAFFIGNNPVYAFDVDIANPRFKDGASSSASDPISGDATPQEINERLLPDVASVSEILEMDTNTTVVVELDPCREKEEDTYYNSKGLWGQDFDDQWAIKRVGFDRSDDGAWSKVGIHKNETTSELETAIVAVIDTGVDWFHPDLPANSIWKNENEIPENGIDDDGNGYVDDVIGWNFIDQDNLPWDHDGHGTFVSGVIAAGFDNKTGITGINPAAKIMPLKALDAFGKGHASMVAEAITYAADNGAKIINLSLGGRNPTTVERLAIEYARQKSALVVAAAGNAGQPVADFSPSSIEGVVTVSATDRQDRRAGFSNWGPAIDIAAPGVDVLSLRARNTDLLSLIPGVTYKLGTGILGPDRAYYRASGTSFAAPIVAGTASLLLSKNPDLTADQLRRMIINSAKDIESTGIDNFTGYGLLDANAALVADPEYFLEARITGVSVVKVQNQQALQIIGSANGDKFKVASILLGKGEKPEKWLKVKSTIDQPKLNERLMLLPAKFFATAPKWTLKLVVEHEDGKTREATYALTLG